MPISAVMINEFSLGQMMGQASMQSGAICFTAFNMAGFSHGLTSDSTAATTTKRQATGQLSMARVKKRQRWCLKEKKLQTVETAKAAWTFGSCGCNMSFWIQNPKLHRIKGEEKEWNDKTKKKKTKRGGKQTREGQVTLEPSQNPQKSKVIQHLTAAHMQKVLPGLLWRQAIQCKKHLNWRGRTTLPYPILIDGDPGSL